MADMLLSRRNFVKMIGAGIVSLALPKAASADFGKKTNFVFILVDDMGWMDMGCYGSQHSSLRIV
ncbi:MAG TPA: hypothetical protein DIU00_08745 [Phycisphaerales bacterium]|nr:hypothetical protein [Phycisphaerales bacterium]